MIGKGTSLNTCDEAMKWLRGRVVIKKSVIGIDDMKSMLNAELRVTKEENTNIGGR